MPKKIQFIKNEIRFRLSDSGRLSSWINRVAKKEGFSVSSLSYVFCTDEYIHEMNKRFLNHDELTDILTFDLSGKEEGLCGEVYISIDRVKENADKFQASFAEELRRVIIHGALHLMGYDDKSPSKAKLMRDKEDASLSLY